MVIIKIIECHVERHVFCSALILMSPTANTAATTAAAAVVPTKHVRLAICQNIDKNPSSLHPHGINILND